MDPARKGTAAWLRQQAPPPVLGSGRLVIASPLKDGLLFPKGQSSGLSGCRPQSPSPLEVAINQPVPVPVAARRRCIAGKEDTVAAAAVSADADVDPMLRFSSSPAPRELIRPANWGASPLDWANAAGGYGTGRRGRRNSGVAAGSVPSFCTPSPALSAKLAEVRQQQSPSPGHSPTRNLTSERRNAAQLRNLLQMPMSPPRGGRLHGRCLERPQPPQQPTGSGCNKNQSLSESRWTAGELHTRQVLEDMQFRGYTMPPHRRKCPMR